MKEISKKRKRFHARIDAMLRRKRNRFPRCWSRVVRSYMAKEERENCKMLFEKFGVKYPLEKKRLRVAYNIPWGVDFDVRNPGACSKVGKWNGALELFAEVWNRTPPKERADFLKVAYDEKNPVLNSDILVRGEA